MWPSVAPAGRHLRAAVRHHGGEIGERLLRRDEIEELGRYRASCGDVLGRVATARPRSVDAVMAEAGTAGSEESEQRDRKDGVTNHSAFACFGGLPGPRRRRRPVFGTACLALGGRPGPLRTRVFDPGGRPGPRRLPLRRRLRPFAGFFFGPVVPSNSWIASRTCS